jgi:DNA repair exonuclease SbcCD ATPase subunit
MATTIEEANRKIAQLEENQKKQNSYITKLEQQNKDLQGAITEASHQMDHVDIRGYVLESRARDFRKEAEANIKRLYGEKVFEAVVPDWEEWLTEYMNVEKASVPFYEQSFQMAYGKALGDPQHRVHGNEEKQIETTEQHLDQENERVLRDVRTIEESKLPSTLSGSEGGTLLPEDSIPISDVQNTEEALKAFRRKMANLGKNPFEE